MAKGGGGAWKVAYADFVTAMMAFFLVMWICSQDQKMKQAVARYFVTPIGLVETGSSKKPNHTGALFHTMNGGSVPIAESVALGRGRSAYTRPDEIASGATKSVGDWLHTSDVDHFWMNEAQIARDCARMSKELLEKRESAEEIARNQLTKRLREHVSRKVQSEHSELSQELLSQILSEVNWSQLADDLLKNHGELNARHD